MRMSLSAPDSPLVKLQGGTYLVFLLMYFLTFFPMYRPTAYSVLIDLLHYLRDDLSHAQIARIIALFSKNINEAGFSFSMQMICLKLLVNFVDRITHLPVKAEGVFFLLHLL